MNRREFLKGLAATSAALVAVVHAPPAFRGLGPPSVTIGPMTMRSEWIVDRTSWLVVFTAQIDGQNYYAADYLDEITDEGLAVVRELAVKAFDRRAGLLTHSQPPAPPAEATGKNGVITR